MAAKKNQAREEPSPILNGPYEEPRRHDATGEDGTLDDQRPLPGRRLFVPMTPQLPLGRPTQGAMFDIDDFAAERRNHLVPADKSRKLAVRVISQFGEESTKVLGL